MEEEEEEEEKTKAPSNILLCSRCSHSEIWSFFHVPLVPDCPSSCVFVLSEEYRNVGWHRILVSLVTMDTWTCVSLVACCVFRDFLREGAELSEGFLTFATRRWTLDPVGVWVA